MASSVADISPAVGTVTGAGSDRLEALGALHKAKANAELPHPTALSAVASCAELIGAQPPWMAPPAAGRKKA